MFSEYRLGQTNTLFYYTMNLITANSAYICEVFCYPPPPPHCDSGLCVSLPPWVIRHNGTACF